MKREPRDALEPPLPRGSGRRRVRRPVPVIRPKTLRASRKRSRHSRPELIFTVGTTGEELRGARGEREKIYIHIHIFINHDNNLRKKIRKNTPRSLCPCSNIRVPRVFHSTSPCIPLRKQFFATPERSPSSFKVKVFKCPWILEKITFTLFFYTSALDVLVYEFSQVYLHIYVYIRP